MPGPMLPRAQQSSRTLSRWSPPHRCGVWKRGSQVTVNEGNDLPVCPSRASPRAAGCPCFYPLAFVLGPHLLCHWRSLLVTLTTWLSALSRSPKPLGGPTIQHHSQLQWVVVSSCLQIPPPPPHFVPTLLHCRVCPPAREGLGRFQSKPGITSPVPVRFSDSLSETPVLGPPWGRSRGPGVRLRVLGGLGIRRQRGRQALMTLSVGVPAGPGARDVCSFLPDLRRALALGAARSPQPQRGWCPPSLEDFWGSGSTQ